MGMLNSVSLQGRFPRSEKFEFKYTPEANGKSAWFRGKLSVQQNFKPKDAQYPDEDIFEIRAFGKTADMIGKYFHHGDMIIVEGELRSTKPYQKEDGTMVYSQVYVSANRVFFAGSKQETQQTQPQAQSQPKQGNQFGGFNFAPKAQAAPF